MTDVITIIAITVAIFGVPLWGAFALDKRLHRIRPNFKPFVWGYYNALGCFIAPIYGLGAITGKNPTMDAISKWQILFMLLIIFAPLGVLALKRNRWAFVAITVLSINPIVWVINGFYLKNRWRELTFNKGDGDERDDADTSELMKASAAGLIDRVDELIAAGCDMNMQTKAGFTALMYAARNGHSAIVELLLKNGADSGIASSMGTTAQSLAKKFRFLEVTQILKIAEKLKKSDQQVSMELHESSPTVEATDDEVGTARIAAAPTSDLPHSPIAKSLLSPQVVHSSVAGTNSVANGSGGPSSRPTPVVVAFCIAVLLAVCAAAFWFIWPTKWKHDHLIRGDNTYPIRTNRFTDETEIFDGSEWSLRKSTVPAVEEELPPAELAKLDGKLQITSYDYLKVQLYNGTEKRIRSHEIVVNVLSNNDEVISSRRYRLTSTGGEALQSSEFIVNCGCSDLRTAKFNWHVAKAWW